MEMPLGILRKGGSSSGESGRPCCEISSHAVRESPSDVALDVALDVGSSNGESVSGKEVDSEVDVHSSQVDGPVCCAELDGSSWVTDCSSRIQVAVDAWIEEGCCGDGWMGSQSGDEDADGVGTWRENVVVEVGRDLVKRMGGGVSDDVHLDGSYVAAGGGGRMNRRSVSCSPEAIVVAGEKSAPVSFISAASCYVEGPSKADMLRDGKSTQRRSSFCRFEAFVIRSPSTMAFPVRDHGSKQTPSNPQG